MRISRPASTSRPTTILFTTAPLVSAVAAEPDGTDTTNRLDRLTLSPRIGFNISAKFKGFGGVRPASAPASRRTPPQPGRPNGDPYNYDDGYVLTNTSDNFGGETWYWGYDDSGSQVSGDSVLLSRSTSRSPSTGSLDSEPYLGGELTYRRELGTHDEQHYGFEAAVNYMAFGVDGKGSLIHTTDAYAFEPRTRPPRATLSDPYQGSYEGPGFLLHDTPVSSTRTTLAGGSSTLRSGAFASDRMLRCRSASA